MSRSGHQYKPRPTRRRFKRAPREGTFAPRHRASCLSHPETRLETLASTASLEPKHFKHD